MRARGITLFPVSACAIFCFSWVARGDGLIRGIQPSQLATERPFFCRSGKEWQGYGAGQGRGIIQATDVLRKICAFSPWAAIFSLLPDRSLSPCALFRLFSFTVCCSRVIIARVPVAISFLPAFIYAIFLSRVPLPSMSTECAVLSLVAVLAAACLGASEAAGGTKQSSNDAAAVQSLVKLAVQPARLQELDEDSEEDADADSEEDADADAEEEAPVPAVPVVPVADNYEAATNADDLITKALEHGTLSAAQAKAILAAAKAAAAADAAKVAAAKKIVEAAKDAEGDAAKEATGSLFGQAFFYMHGNHHCSSHPHSPCWFYLSTD